MKNMKKIAGFTFMEMIIVVSIIGVIAAVAIPQYGRYVIRTKRADAMSALMSAVQAVERYKANNNFSYLGVDTAAIIPTQVPVDGGTAAYTIAFVGTPGVKTYSLIATPTGNAQPVSDGNLTIDQSGGKFWSKVSKNCWPESGGDDC